MTTDQTIILARKHASVGPMASSARLALQDAIALEEKGELVYAKRRALESLRYSVGIFHADYVRAAK